MSYEKWVIKIPMVIAVTRKQIVEAKSKIVAAISFPSLASRTPNFQEYTPNIIAATTIPPAKAVAGIRSVPIYFLLLSCRLILPLTYNIVKEKEKPETEFEL